MTGLACDKDQFAQQLQILFGPIPTSVFQLMLFGVFYVLLPSHEYIKQSTQNLALLCFRVGTMSFWCPLCVQ